MMKKNQYQTNGGGVIKGSVNKNGQSPKATKQTGSDLRNAKGGKGGKC